MITERVPREQCTVCGIARDIEAGHIGIRLALVCCFVKGEACAVAVLDVCAECEGLFESVVTVHNAQMAEGGSR